MIQRASAVGPHLPGEHDKGRSAINVEAVDDANIGQPHARILERGRQPGVRHGARVFPQHSIGLSKPRPLLENDDSKKCGCQWRWRRYRWSEPYMAVRPPVRTSPSAEDHVPVHSFPALFFKEAPSSKVGVIKMPAIIPSTTLAHPFHIAHNTFQKHIHQIYFLPTRSKYTIANLLAST